MACYGKIEEFKTDTGDWTEYVERLTQYFVANDIEANEKKRAILLSVCGEKTYGLLRSLVAPSKPGEKTYTDLVTVMEEHHNPKPSVILQRFKFNCCVRKKHQSVAEFVADLRHLAEHCEYKEKLEEMLRDRIVVGVNDDKIQRRLLSEATLDFKRAFEIAQGLESAAKSADEISKASRALPTAGSGASGDIHKVTRNTRQSTKSAVMTKSAQASKSQVNDSRKEKLCYRCNGKHDAKSCRFKDSECFSCHRKGHISAACRNRTKPDRQRTKVNVVEDSVEYEMFHISSKIAPYKVDVALEGRETTMEIDTGASVSIINEECFKELSSIGKPLALRKSNVVLSTYTKSQLPLLGMTEVNVQYKNQQRKLPLYVIKGKGPNLFGRNWLETLKIDWAEIHMLSSRCDDIIRRYPELFEEGLGSIKNVTGHINVPANATPRFFKPRSVPFSMKEKVDNELDRLLRENIIESVEHSDWAAPIVPILKSNGEIRICGDFKVTCNREVKIDCYPIPAIDDLYAKLSGGKLFSKIDLSNAYLQINLDEESKKFVTINTHRGLFRYNRLPFGVSSSPGIFQRVMETILSGIPNVCVYLDDILVMGSDDKGHAQALQTVLKRLADAGVRLKKEKCEFAVTEVSYLGYKIDEAGIHPLPDRVRAISEAPTPTSTTELKSFLGLLNYYGRFLPNLSTVLAPLYKLLRANVVFDWGVEQEKAFKQAKSMLQSSRVLAHYDPQKPLALYCDSSQYGIGVVLSHVMKNGEDRPVCYASRSLSAAEKNYSQLEKEALACVWGVKKLHKYLFGREFVIYNDHKPLESLLSEVKQVPSMAASRIQRWSLTLSAYNYRFVYKPGSMLANADALSRLPLPDTHTDTPTSPDTIFLLEALDNSPVKSTSIKQWTDRDPILSKVRRLILSGWTEINDPDLKHYSTKRNELSVENGCILWGSRVIVPPQGRQLVVDLLHEAHPGIVNMKRTARSYVWWPNMDAELELKVKQCEECQINQKLPPTAPIHHWTYPCKPWSRIHLDYAGPVDGKMLLVTADAYSKWIDVQVMTNCTAEATVNRLRVLFATFGLPDTVVSDNAAAFTGYVCKEFFRLNGIKHVTSEPFHPRSNGMAERAVQIVKTGIKKMTKGDLQSKVARVLFRYRVTKHSTTGKTPAELMFGRNLKTHLDLLHPGTNHADRVRDAQEKQKLYGDMHSHFRSFNPGDPVYVVNFGQGLRWIPGVVTEVLGPVTYMVEVEGMRNPCKRHVDHLRSRDCESNISVETSADYSESPFNLPSQQTTTSSVNDELDKHHTAVSKDEISPESLTTPAEEVITPGMAYNEPTPTEDLPSPEPCTPPISELRRSQRVRKPVVRFQAS